MTVYVVRINMLCTAWERNSWTGCAFRLSDPQCSPGHGPDEDRETYDSTSLVKGLETNRRTNRVARK